MKKRMFVMIMALAVGVSSMPPQYAGASWYDDEDDDDWYDDNDGDWYYADNGWYYADDDDWYDDDWDDWDDDELTVDDLSVSPVRKKIRAGRSFHIDVIPSDDSGWEDWEEEDWEELCEDNIESIEYRSTKSRVASVNKFTGKVKAKRKGSAVIKTRVTLTNDESIVFKTRVIVTR